jgi:glycosyltransferase involved in cell wall biosynthesis
MSPLVSICMPHLNSQPFTAARLESILGQTCADWELVVVDSGSDDGSREMIESCARSDPRVQVMQAPRDGIYRSLNRAIERSRGKYIYIATSDDTMSPDCLERMSAALDANPDCGMCHCRLTIIGPDGLPVRTEDAWESSEVQRYYGPWLDKLHVRRAPHDGLLHFRFISVYTSLTQLLIRRELFSRHGMFRTDCGSHADFEWEMRVSLHENVLHLPAALATWRRHDRQATQNDLTAGKRSRGEFSRLVPGVLTGLRTRDPALARVLRRSWLSSYHLADELRVRRLAARAGMARLLEGVRFTLRHPRFVGSDLVRRLRGRGLAGVSEDAVRSEIARIAPGPLLIELGSTAADPHDGTARSSAGAR